MSVSLEKELEFAVFGRSDPSGATVVEARSVLDALEGGGKNSAGVFFTLNLALAVWLLRHKRTDEERDAVAREFGPTAAALVETVRMHTPDRRGRVPAAEGGVVLFLGRA